MTKYLLPRLRDILFISIFLAVLFFGPRIFNLDGDLGRHITVGNVIIENLSIPTQDIFSHTMNGEPLTPHEWLAQIFFAFAHGFNSLSGVVFFTALIIAIVFLIVYYDSKERSGSYLLSFLIAIFAAISSSLHWLARPHIFTFLYLAIWTYYLEKYRRGEKVALWKFALVMIFWVNTHGAFITAFVTWGAYFVGALVSGYIKTGRVGEKLKNWGSIGLVSFFISFINPVGVYLWRTNFDFLKSSYLVGHTQEYLPPNFHNPSALPFLILIALSLFLLSQKKTEMPLSHGFLLAGWTIMGLYSARNIPLYAIIIAPILSEVMTKNIKKTSWAKLERRIKKIERKLKGGFLPVLILSIALLLASNPMVQSYNRFSPEVFPVDAANWLDENEQEGKVFNHFPWGGYLLYRNFPSTLVFIDGQTDFYGEELTREYEQVITLADGWERVLERYEVDWVIIPSSSLLAGALKQDSWTELYEDKVTVILRRE
ncbi:MAG: hypothetical protein HN392_01690 [Anaerolineae bacterium]|nr:hypothetical protein [Anaerolineae bacterium]